MKFFGMKAAAPADVRPVLARAWGTGAVALGEWPASYEAQLRAGVIGNPVAQRAMRLVSEGAGATALKVAGVEDGARVLALVARASAGQGLVETLACHLLLHGNAYVQLIGGADGMPAELFALRPERVKREMEIAFAGAANAGRPMLLEGGLSWKALSLTPAEMDFVGLKAAAAREIALAFGVPPMLMGLPGDNSYANYREANKALWRQTILPLVGKICAGLGQGLAGWWPGLRIEPDLDGVAALSDERAALWERVAGAVFLSAEEKKALLGL